MNIMIDSFYYLCFFFVSKCNVKKYFFDKEVLRKIKISRVCGVFFISLWFKVGILLKM